MRRFKSIYRQVLTFNFHYYYSVCAMFSVEVRGQVCGVGSLLPPWVSSGDLIQVSDLLGYLLDQILHF